MPTKLNLLWPQTLLLYQVCSRILSSFPLISFVPAKILVLRCRTIFSFSSKGTVDYDKLDLAESVSDYLEFCKTQPESSKAPLLNHFWTSPFNGSCSAAVTYSWPSVRNFHLSVNNAVEQGHLTWNSFKFNIIREQSQIFLIIVNGELKIVKKRLLRHKDDNIPQVR